MELGSETGMGKKSGSSVCVLFTFPNPVTRVNQA